MENLPVSLCPHLDDNSAPYIGLQREGVVYWLCPACYLSKILTLISSCAPTTLARNSFVEREHVEAIVVSLSVERRARADKGQTRIANRLRVLVSALNYIFGNGKSSKPMVTALPRHYCISDNGPPSYRRTKFIPCVVEPKSLSSFADVVVVNRAVTA
jgi:hypothetical protein